MTGAGQWGHQIVRSPLSMLFGARAPYRAESIVVFLPGRVEERELEGFALGHDAGDIVVKDGGH